MKTAQAKLTTPSLRKKAATPGSTCTSLQDQKALTYAKTGIVLALFAGLFFSINSLLIRNASSYSPFNNKNLLLLVPFICVGVHDFCAAVVTTTLNWRAGKFKEIGRSLVSKPGRFVIAGAVIGALFGMGGYMTALQLAGPAYVLPITSLYPAVAAVLAVFILKEKISLRAWVGLTMCVCGAITVGYTQPDGQQGDLFYWGLAFAGLAAIGWGTEGVCATSGMDFIEPEIALNIYYCISSLLYVCIIPTVATLVLPSGEVLQTLGDFLTSYGILFVAGAGFIGSGSYRCWYKAMNMTGVSRAMALNISYALWGILLSFLFTEVHITTTLIIGALFIFCGMFLVIGNPRDMFNLRKID